MHLPAPIFTVQSETLRANDFHLGHHRKPYGWAIYRKTGRFFGELGGDWPFEKRLTEQRDRENPIFGLHQELSPYLGRCLPLVGGQVSGLAGHGGRMPVDGKWAGVGERPLVDGEPLCTSQTSLGGTNLLPPQTDILQGPPPSPLPASLPVSQIEMLF